MSSLPIKKFQAGPCPAPTRGRRAPWRLLCTGLLASLALSCAGGPKTGGVGGSKLPLVREQFIQPAGVLSLRWSRPLVTDIKFFSYKPQEFAIAAVSDDASTVFIGSSARTFYALSARSGDVIWARDLGSGISSEPRYVPAGGAAGPEPLLLLGDDDGRLIAMRARDGEIKWQSPRSGNRGPIQTAPVVHNGRVYVASISGHVEAYKLEDGKEVWRYERTLGDGFAIRGNSNVLVVGEKIYVGFPDGYLACLSAESGEVLWSRSLAGDKSRFTDVDSTPILHAGTLYVSCFATGVYALDPKDGSTKWRFDLDNAGPVAVDPVSERVYAVSSTQGLFAIDNKGRKLWQQSLAKQGELMQPVIYGPYLLITAAVSGLYVADKETGELLQSFDPGQGATAPPLAVGSSVYLLSNAGAFFALRRG